jgi:hypothetical protein
MAPPGRPYRQQACLGYGHGMKQLTALLALLVLSGGCTAELTSTPTPDIQATVDAAVAAAIASQPTAIPTWTPEPTWTPRPTPTLQPTPTLEPTPTPTASSLPVIRLPTQTPTPPVVATALAVNDTYGYSVKVPPGWEVTGSDDWFYLRYSTEFAWPNDEAHVAILTEPHLGLSLASFHDQRKRIYQIAGYNRIDQPDTPEDFFGWPAIHTSFNYVDDGTRALVRVGDLRTIFVGENAIQIRLIHPIGSCCTRFTAEADFMYESFFDSLR